MDMIRPLKMFLIFALLVSAQLTAASQRDYFSTVSLCSSEELARELKQKTLDMCWHFGQDSHFRFIGGNDEVYFEIALRDLSKIDGDFVSRVKDKFIERSSGESQQLVFSYKVKNDGEEEVNVPQPFMERGRPDEHSYIVTDRRIIENTTPQLIGREELAVIVRNENVLFYTGAGLSIASGIPGMNELCDLLGFENGEKFLLSLETALNNPRDFASKILSFHNACLFSTPSKAHFALKELATIKNIRMITENLDCLHESSGIHPYRIDPKYLRDEIGEESMSCFNYIICVGLSFDDRGFLGWYKQCNPQGKIIAVDLQQPSYLGNDDYLLLGDLQEIVPFLEDAVNKPTKQDFSIVDTMQVLSALLVSLARGP